MIGGHVGALVAERIVIQRPCPPLNAAPATTARQKPLPSTCPNISRPRMLRELNPGPQRSLCRGVDPVLGIEPMTTRCLVVALTTKLLGRAGRPLSFALRTTGRGSAQGRPAVRRCGSAQGRPGSEATGCLLRSRAPRLAVGKRAVHFAGFRFLFTYKVACSEV